MTNQNKMISIGVIALVVIGVGAFFLGQRSAAPTTAGNLSSGSPTTTATSGGTPTRAPAPANVTVPAQGQVVAPNVAAPQIVSPANSHSSASYRSFSIQADG